MFALIYRRSDTAILGRKSAERAQHHLGHRADVKNVLSRQRVQAKLAIGATNDRFEREADRVADEVIRMPVRDMAAAGGGDEASRSTIRRVRTAGGYDDHPAEQGEHLVKAASACTACRGDGGAVQARHGLPEIQRQTDEEEEEERLQAKSDHGTTVALTHDAATQVQRIRQGGRPLASADRAFFEPRFGRDFRQVRIHTGGQAAQVARAIQARAFTVGRDVVFGAGQYAPQTMAGQRLLAHELTHVVQQGAYGEASDIARLDSEVIQRTALPIAQIRQEIEQGSSAPTNTYSWIQILGEQTGHIAHAADFPGGQALTRMPSPVPPPDPQPVPTVSRWPIEAYFFPAHVQHTDRRALIMGGFHGDERPGYQMVDTFIDQLRAGRVPLAFHTLLIPRVNRGAIEDDQAGVRWYDRRSNRQFVDLNRNFRVPGAPTPSRISRAPNTHLAPIQPETQGVIDVVQGFQPHRIVSGHAVRSLSSAGIFADPNTHPTATQLALAMAGRLTHPSDRRANRLGTSRAAAVYPGGDTPGQRPSEPTFGRYAPTASRPGHMTPVITIEAPEYHSLAATGVRSREGYAGALAAFVAEPATLADADLQIVRDIQAMTIADRRLFLTGRMASTSRIYQRIQDRINNAVTLLNGLRPRRPNQVRVVSGRRAFGTRVGRASPQAQIVFEKFTLTGSRANGWDTLPTQYYVGGNRSAGVDRTAWDAVPSDRRLEIILEFSAVPGASRHHWGTDVDFNSTTNSDWAPSPGRGRPAGQFYALGQWLERNGPRVGFFRTYTTGRTGGHAPEPWHYSYEPIARPLRAAYNRDVRLQQDIVDPILQDWRSRASAAGVTLPADLRAALLALDLSQYVNRIGPGL